MTASQVRINKLLAPAVGSRRRVDALIRKGLVSVNGHPAAIGMKIGPLDILSVLEPRFEDRATNARCGSARAHRLVEN